MKSLITSLPLLVSFDVFCAFVKRRACLTKLVLLRRAPTSDSIAPKLVTATGSLGAPQHSLSVAVVSEQSSELAPAVLDPSGRFVHDLVTAVRDLFIKFDFAVIFMSVSIHISLDLQFVVVLVLYLDRRSITIAIPIGNDLIFLECMPGFLKRIDVVPVILSCQHRILL